MVKIICFEGVHGVGKGTLINFLLKEFKDHYSGEYAVIRDSEYPEFEKVKKAIRTGILFDKEEIISTVAKTRSQIYSNHINDHLKRLDLAILDRSYYTSAVWQSESYEEMYRIIHENENLGIPKADLTFILHAPLEVIINRLVSRNRRDLSKYNQTRIAINQEKYLHIAENREECIPYSTDGNPTNLAKDIYSIISANNAL